MTAPTVDRKPKLQYSLGMLFILFLMASITVGSGITAYYSHQEVESLQRQYYHERMAEDFDKSLSLLKAESKIITLTRELEALKVTNMALWEAKERAEKELQALTIKQTR